MKPKDNLLQTFWIKNPESVSRIGFGVTGYSLDDALLLLKEAGYPVDPSAPGTTVRENITFAELDENHVVPNIGPMIFRGVWYPLAHGGAKRPTPNR